MRADLVAYDKDGQLVVVVEVKNKTGTSRQWSVQMRRNIYAHGFWPKTRYFLLVLPDRFYLWKNAPNTPEVVEPDYELDALVLLKPYYERSGLSPEDLSGAGFELLVASWLSELMQTGVALSADQQSWLVDSGLLEAISGGRLISEAEI